MPDNVRFFIQSKVPTFLFRYSKTVEGKYFANTCPRCKVIYGNFFCMMSLERLCFLLTRKAKLLYIKEIPLDGPIEIDGGAGSGTGEMILEHAIKV